ncbi:MAG: type II toxin-antitoxin system VapC family toxin [Deltaproteobacteria bacterium]|nr:type II toxin-antitoxin system VapC family toxin [Deltaproteobacteria bacterium]
MSESKKSTSEIDEGSLPVRVALDTSVVVAALLNGDEDEASSMFLDAMIKNKKTIMVPSPVLAEALVGGVKGIQHVPFMRTIAFDEKAAIELATSFPKKSTLTNPGDPKCRRVFKFDGMILATAKRFNCDCFVTLDAKQLNLADHVGMNAKRPSDFLLKQLSLPVGEAVGEGVEKDEAGAATRGS